eukprot:TRINITY_DN13633_c0_g1_i1.p2 TRINITY_DN13633_c0_g1~~TRINITY_DN13633_c0_g1_i1.p2  ORF type:complete len:107 (-),score=5.52 TRINITY_DN13633_c0_g1_i1:385-705(-)
MKSNPVKVCGQVIHQRESEHAVPDKGQSRGAPGEPAGPTKALSAMSEWEPIMCFKYFSRLTNLDVLKRSESLGMSIKTSQWPPFVTLSPFSAYYASSPSIHLVARS